MDRWQAMQVFVRVAEQQSFAAAARQLNLSPPAVTRSVAALEDAIGARLLTRTTRSVKLTEAGQRYVEDCRRILADAAEAEAAAAGSYATPSGTLTVTAPVQFGRLSVLPVVHEYLSRYPAVSVRTLFLDRVVNLMDEGADVAIRIADLPDSSLKAVRVGSVRQVLCAAPDYLERHGVPNIPADLRAHDIIGSTSLASTVEWRFGRKAGMGVTLRPRLICNTIDAALASAIAGQGVARLLSYQVAPAIADGRLVVVLERNEPEPRPVHIVSADGRRGSAKVRAFIDLAVERLRADPRINPRASAVR